MPSMSELLGCWPRRRFWPPPFLASIRYAHSTSSASFPVEVDEPTKPRGKWLTLPPFAPSVNAASLGKELYGRRPAAEAEPTTVLKWVRRCCPHLPMSLLQKLFRLRQVRKNQITVEKSCCNDATDAEQSRLRRVSAKDAMMPGEVIFLPVTVEEFTIERSEKFKYNDVEISFVRDLELYKDEAIIVVNKPPGMPTQGGVGIRYSMDGLAANCLKYDFSQPPRLVHRLDRDSSGVLVLGRTQTSTSILHSLFREKTSGALTEDMTQRTLQRKYLALVIGTPRHPRGLISAPLAKIVLEDGKSERIIIADEDKSPSAQHALTEYNVIRTSTHGYTWLELFPLTGRKHQLRVHCADILRTPIVGDYKYGRHAHRQYEPMRSLEPTAKCEKIFKQNFPFGLQLDGGSITEKSPRLHLHCKQMTLPNISVALQQLQLSEDYDLSKLEKLNLVAPLPPHMQTSWKILTSMS